MQDLEEGDFTLTEQKATKCDREALIGGRRATQRFVRVVERISNF